MPQGPSKISQFWQELKRRRVIHVIVVYASASFVIIELVNNVFETLRLPEWTPALTLIILAVGFPLAIIFSWIFDITPEGIEKTKPSGEVQKEEKTIPQNSWKIATYISLVIILGLIAYNIFKGSTHFKIDESLEKSVAILPFLNLSGDPDQEFICDGLTDEIITNLFKIASFERVPTLNSVLRYKNSDKSISTISEELGVNYILEGSYKRLDDWMRFTVILKESKSDRQIWYYTYDQDSELLSAIPSKIALQIAEQLNTYLSGSEKEILAEIPTDNEGAWIKYVEGNYYFRRTIFQVADLNKALELYEEATTLDPRFALAFAYMARTYSRIYWSKYDRSHSLLEECEKAFEKALSINPELPEAYVARGEYYYRGFLDYANALEQLEIASGYMPGHAEIRYLKALIYQRMGKWELAIEEFEIAHKLDPDSQLILVNMSGAYTYTGNYDKASEYFDKLHALDPDNLNHYAAIFRFYISRDGNTVKARELIEGAVIVNKPMYESSGALKYLIPVMLDIYEGNYQKALDYMSDLPWEGKIDQLNYYPKDLLKAWMYQLLNLQNQARFYFDSARIQLENRLLDLPEEPRILSALGVAYAGLGNKVKAIEYGTKAVELYPYEKDYVFGLFRNEDLAWIYILVEEYEKALEQIEILVSNNGPISVPFLKLSPKYKPLWDHPEFIRLTALYD